MKQGSSIQWCAPQKMERVQLCISLFYYRLDLQKLGLPCLATSMVLQVLHVPGPGSPGCEPHWQEGWQLRAQLELEPRQQGQACGSPCSGAGDAAATVEGLRTWQPSGKKGRLGPAGRGQQQGTSPCVANSLIWNQQVLDSARPERFNLQKSVCFIAFIRGQTQVYLVSLQQDCLQCFCSHVGSRILDKMGDM